MQHSFSKVIRGLARATATLALISCGEGASPEPVTVQVATNLVRIMTVTVNGTVMDTIVPGLNTFSFPAGTRKFEWTIEPTRYEDGSPIPDDLRSRAVLIDGSRVTITNVIDGQTYFAPALFAAFNRNVVVGISQAGVLRCLVTIRPSDGFVQLTYYRLDEQTELRAYSPAIGCTGEPYRVWAFAELRQHTNDEVGGMAIIGLPSPP
jgi:hypothetical protein